MPRIPSQMEQSLCLRIVSFYDRAMLRKTLNQLPFSVSISEIDAVKAFDPRDQVNKLAEQIFALRIRLRQLIWSRLAARLRQFFASRFIGVLSYLEQLLEVCLRHLPIAGLFGGLGCSI